jgi:hypothetical protein
MATPKELYYEKRGNILVKNLRSRHFDAYYCANKEEALAKAKAIVGKKDAKINAIPDGIAVMVR